MEKMTRKPFVAVFLGLLSSVALTPEAAEAIERAESLLPSGREFRLVWNDEFDGDSLDAS